MALFFASDDSFYFLVDKTITVNFILKKIDEYSGMRKGSFADFYVKKIINQLLRGASNLSDIYSKYFVDEYESFDEYLFKKELFDMELLDKISSFKNASIWKLNLSCNDYSVKNLLNYDIDIKHIIEKMIEDIINED